MTTVVVKHLHGTVLKAVLQALNNQTSHGFAIIELVDYKNTSSDFGVLTKITLSHR